MKNEQARGVKGLFAGGGGGQTEEEGFPDFEEFEGGEFVGGG